MIPGGRQSNYIKNIFEWDGYANSLIPSNLDLWQDIYDTQLQTDVFVFYRQQNSYTTMSLFIIPKNSLPSTDNSITRYSVTYSFSSSTYNSTNTLNNSNYRFILSTNNGAVTKINEIQINNNSAGSILKTDYNYSIPYIPQYPGSPATKKYVDDSINNIDLIDNLFFTTKDYINYEDNPELWNNIYTTQKLKDCYLISTISDSNIPIIYFIERDSLTNTSSTQQQTNITSNPYMIGSRTVSNSVTNDYINKGYITITTASDNVISVSYQLTTTQNGGPYLSTATSYSTPYTPLYEGSPATKKYADDLIVIGDEQDASANTMILFDEDELGYVSEVVDSLTGNEHDKSPSVSAVNQKLTDLIASIDNYTVLYNDTSKIGTAGTITLSQNPLNFDYIKVMGYIVCTDSNLYSSSFCNEIYITNKADGTNYTGNITSSVYNGNNYNYICSEKLTFNSDKTITRGVQKVYRTDATLYNANINIVTVLGYKRSF